MGTDGRAGGMARRLGPAPTGAGDCKGKWGWSGGVPEDRRTEGAGAAAPAGPRRSSAGGRPWRRWARRPGRRFSLRLRRSLDTIGRSPAGVWRSLGSAGGTATGFGCSPARVRRVRMGLCRLRTKVCPPSAKVCRSPEEARRSPVEACRPPAKVRRPSEGPWRLPEEVGRSAEGLRRSSERVRPSPERVGRSPDKACRSPEEPCRSAEGGRRSPARARRSPEEARRSSVRVIWPRQRVGRSSGGGCHSPEGARRSPGRTRRSPEWVRRSSGRVWRSPAGAWRRPASLGVPACTEWACRVPPGIGPGAVSPPSHCTLVGRA